MYPLDTYLDLLWNITDGFPIVNCEVPPYKCENYTSITTSPNKEVMGAIIRKELVENCVSYTESQPTCIHASGAVPKGDNNIRPITDCSRPPFKSVNYHCSSLLEEFKLKNISDVVDLLEEYEYLSVIDIKSAYRAVPIREEHRKFQGFSWELDGVESYYVDNRMCFGLRLGPSYFNRISCFIQDTLTYLYGLRSENYLDDFLTVSYNLDEAVADRDMVVSLLSSKP